MSMEAEEGVANNTDAVLELGETSFLGKYSVSSAGSSVANLQDIEGMEHDVLLPLHRRIFYRFKYSTVDLF